MGRRAADQEDRDRCVSAIRDGRYGTLERAQREFPLEFGLKRQVEDFAQALMRHIQQGGALEVEDHEPTSRRQTRSVFRVSLEFAGCEAFSHFYILPESSFQNHWVQFESIHKSR